MLAGPACDAQSIPICNTSISMLATYLNQSSSSLSRWHGCAVIVISWWHWPCTLCPIRCGHLRRDGVDELPLLSLSHRHWPCVSRHCHHGLVMRIPSRIVQVSSDSSWPSLSFWRVMRYRCNGGGCGDRWLWAAMVMNNGGRRCQ